jgi:NAD(P)-dependent dehydrogenase (short-subunit alcohol dehydrogenase family)
LSPREIKDVRYDFSGRVVLITGAGRGQGRSHALAFAKAGADVVICDIGDTTMGSVAYALASTDDLNSVAAEVEAAGVKCLACVCDVRDSAQIQTMVSDAISEFGKIDILVNNAGIDTIFSVADMTEEAWDEMLDTQLRGTFLCSKYVSAHMVERNKGKIVTTSSVNGFLGGPKQAHYVAAKHGMLGFSKSLAIELAPHGINVNCVCPGAIDTPMSQGIMASKDGEWLGELGALTGPWNLFNPEAMLESEEITQAILWLSSDASDFVTGSALVVDAGFTIK